MKDRKVNLDDPVEGYYRFPTMAGEQIVFISEDDLWTVQASGGTAYRLSAGLGKVRTVTLSRDGRWLAFSSTEEGHSEIFMMSARGGEAKRMTYLGCDTRVVGWTPVGEILFASNHEQAFGRLTELYKVLPSSGAISKIPCGPATHIDFDSKGRMVIARHGGTDLAYWKRYRGGTAGEIWIDRKGSGSFKQLLQTPTNSARPYWLGSRIYFISDHEGVGQVYSVAENGLDMKCHSDCAEYYARGLSVNGDRLIYHAGGDLFVIEPESATPRKVRIDYRSPRTQLNRRFVSAGRFLEDYEMHPSGERAVISARGKSFSFGYWKGPVVMHGVGAGKGAGRTRLARFLNDGKRIALLNDQSGEEALEVHHASTNERMQRLVGLDLGRATEMKLSPVADAAAIANHRNELLLVDLKAQTCKVLDSSAFEPISGFNWSPDGRWIAYGYAENERTSSLRICDTQSGEIHQITKAILRDERPFFDPLGEYLYFLSYREFDPMYDNLHFDLSFPRGCKPFLLTLRADVVSPFSSDHPGRSAAKTETPKAEPAKAAKREKSDKKTVPPVEIDFEGIEDRMIELPVADGRYDSIAATKDKVYFTRYPLKGSLKSEWMAESVDAQLEMFDIDSRKMETLLPAITSFRITQDGRNVMYRAGNTLRVMKSGEKPPRETDDHKRGGWLDLERVKVPVQPRLEWRQMYRETWRLQRDHFWTEDMSKVDWVRVYKRYLPLLTRVSSRSEVSDVIWEMQGELGTSHAYEIGGDYRAGPYYAIGFLGVETQYDPEQKGYRLNKVMKGDIWDEACSSPLARAGLGLKAGDLLISIDGRKLTGSSPIQRNLIHCAGSEVAVTFRRRGSKTSETRSVKTLHSEQMLRYREWVEGNRRIVHEKSKGRVGYLHIPNMGPFGFSEFHRAFLTELDCDGLIIDVRFNGGGHVSQLLLEQLARKRIGYSKSRWFGARPYPLESPAGSMVALTNEYAGSDGDIFSHSFKLLKLGPLIGKRTWGGVIGISPRHSLVDGSVTTQPEYSYWFKDVGWKVENYGTDPDIEVEYLPSDYVAGRDPQLTCGLEVCLERIRREPPVKPSFENPPDLSLPEAGH